EDAHDFLSSSRGELPGAGISLLGVSAREVLPVSLGLTVSRVERYLLAFAALGAAVITVLLALGTLPSRMEAQDSGRLVPWLISWGLTWIGVGVRGGGAGILVSV